MSTISSKLIWSGNFIAASLTSSSLPSSAGVSTERYSAIEADAIATSTTTAITIDHHCHHHHYGQHFSFFARSSKKKKPERRGEDGATVPRHRKVFDVHQQQNPNKNPIKRSEKRTAKAFSMIRRMSKIGSRQFSIFLFILFVRALFFLFCYARLESLCITCLFCSSYFLFLHTHTLSHLLFIHVSCIRLLQDGHSTFFGFEPKFVIRTCSIPDGHFSLVEKNEDEGRREKRLSVADPFTQSFFFFSLNFPIFLHTGNF